VADGVDYVAGARLPLGADHRGALRDPPEGFAQVTAAAHERNAEAPFVDVVLLVSGREDLALVDVVDLERLEHLRLDEVADAGLRHHRDRHGLLDLSDLSGIGHAGDPALLADVGGDAFERHDRDGAGLLGDPSVLGVRHVHDHPALEHLGEAALDAHRSVLGHLRDSN
jgi:hypothetical protein